MCYVELALKGVLCTRLSLIAAMRLCHAHDGYAMLMRLKNAERAVHGCHWPGEIAVRMPKVLASPWVGVRVCHLLLWPEALLV